MRISPRPFGELSPAVKLTLAAVACGYVLGLIAGPSAYSIFGIVPERVFREYWVWQLFTYLFIHGSIWHVLMNMLMIWMIGTALESVWGPKKFLKFFVYAGMASGLANVLVTPHSSVPIIGASGAVYGMLAAFAATFPDSIIYLYFLFPVKARYMAVILGVIEFASSFNPASGVANFVHLSGLVFGYAYVRWGPRLAAGLSSIGSRETARYDFVKHRDHVADDDIDALLEKISRNGVESLSPEEKTKMRKYSERMKSR